MVDLGTVMVKSLSKSAQEDILSHQGGQMVDSDARVRNILGKYPVNIVCIVWSIYF